MNYPPPTDMNVVQRLVTVYWGALIKIRDKSLGGGQPSNQDVWLASWMTLKRVGPCVTCVRRPMCFMSDVSHHHTLLLFRPAADICCSLAAGASLENCVCLYWRRLRTEVWLHQHLRFLCFLFFFVIFWWWPSVMSHFVLPKLTHLIIHHQYDTPARQSIENYTLHITSPLYRQHFISENFKINKLASTDTSRWLMSIKFQHWKRRNQVVILHKDNR